MPIRIQEFQSTPDLQYLKSAYTLYSIQYRYKIVFVFSGPENEFPFGIVGAVENSYNNNNRQAEGAEPLAGPLAGSPLLIVSIASNALTSGQTK